MRAMDLARAIAFFAVLTLGLLALAASAEPLPREKLDLAKRTVAATSPANKFVHGGVWFVRRGRPPAKLESDALTNGRPDPLTLPAPRRHLPSKIAALVARTVMGVAGESAS